MLKPEKNLRWLGIDMRSRWRRRAAVVVTYTAFIAAVSAAQDDRWDHPFLTMFLLGAVVQFLGVFSPTFGPVKPFDDLSPNRQQSKYVFVHGLDSARDHRYDVANYDAATPEQQSDLLQTYHVGLRVYPRKQSQDGQYGLSAKLWLDEREKGERAEAQQWARRWVTTMLAVVTGQYIGLHHDPTRGQVVGDLFWLAILGWTLPAARILWTEADPRETPGELALVQEV